MILADTNIWIDFQRGRKNVQVLSSLLVENRVATHPWVIAELRLGNLGRARRDILENITELHTFKDHSIDDLNFFIEEERLYSKGLSLTDVQLLYSTIMEEALLWTHDKKLHQASHYYGKAFTFST